MLFPTGVPEGIRVCAAGQDVVSNGQTYAHCPFEIGLPPDTEDAQPRLTLRIANADRAIVESVRSITSPMKVQLSVVLAGSPDTVEMGPLEFTLRDTRYDAGIVEGELRYEDILNEPFPAAVVTPGRFPGVFKG